jgi:hypothetical protein
MNGSTDYIEIFAEQAGGTSGQIGSSVLSIGFLRSL